MNALSIFRRHPNRYEVLFFAALALTVPTYYVGYESASSSRTLAICGLITFVASVRMALHCLAYPKPQGNFFMPLYSWWYRNCRKLDSYPVNGVWYYSSLCDIRTWALYDRDGYHVGWHGESHYDGERFVKWGPNGSRLPWMVRWRSGSLPKVQLNQAEVIDASGATVGHTTYKVN